LFATLITLFIVPVNYLILEDMKAYFRRYKADMGGLFGRRGNKVEATDS
jgi:hypothetical protein